MQNPNETISKHSRKRLAVDDIQVASSSATTSTSATRQITTSELLIRLEARIVSAEKLLSEINTFLVNSTTDIILSTKPIFDEQKRSLIRLRGFIERSHNRHNHNNNNTTTNGSPLNLSRLHDSTDFKDWNVVAVEVNKLCTSIEKNAALEEAQKTGELSPVELGEKQKSLAYTWTVYFNRIVVNRQVIYILAGLIAALLLLFFLWKLDLLLTHANQLYDVNISLRGPIDIAPTVVQFQSEAQFKSWLPTEKFVFVNFFVPDCQHCKRVMVLWSKLQAIIIMENIPVLVAQVDCSKWMDLCTQEGLSSFPVFRMYKEGVTQSPDFRKTEGKIVLKDVIDYLNGKITK